LVTIGFLLQKTKRTMTYGLCLLSALCVWIVLAYVVIGIWLVFVCQAIGEIATLLPLPGGFTSWGSRFFDEAFSFQL
jgi:lysine-specific permease